MLKTYKVEIKPTDEQKNKIERTFGTCRYIYNFYLAHNKEIYEKEKRFMDGYEFSKWLNNEFIPNNQEYSWIKEVSSKAVKQSIMNGDKAFKRFFKNLSKFPRFKKKGKSRDSCYFPKNNKKDFLVERHRIKIPTLKWMRIKEYGYIPTNSIVKNGTITKQAERYYLSVLVEETTPKKPELFNFGLGVDLGVRDFAIISNGTVYKNINKSFKIRRLKKKLKREQRKLSRKYESLKQIKKIKKEDATRQNIQKQLTIVQRLHKRLSDIRMDYLNKTINDLVKIKPRFINIEDLDVTQMMKDKHTGKQIAEQNFYTFREKLISKCKVLGIEVRLTDRFYPSSKTCHNCRNIKKDLKRSDKTYRCEECGAIIDRDLNAALNLRDNQIYKLAY